MNLDLSAMAKAAEKRSAFSQEEGKLLGRGLTVEFQCASASSPSSVERTLSLPFHVGEEVERLKIVVAERLGVSYDALEMRLGGEDGKPMLDPLTLKDILGGGGGGEEGETVRVHVVSSEPLPTEADLEARNAAASAEIGANGAAGADDEEEDEDDDEDALDDEDFFQD